MPPREYGGRLLEAILYYDKMDLDLVSRFETIVDGYSVDTMTPTQIAQVFGELNTGRYRQVVQQYIDHMEGRLV